MVGCSVVLRELSNLIDNDIDLNLRLEIQEHLQQCHQCALLLDTTRKVIYILGDDRIFEVPAGYHQRLHQALAERLRLS